MAQNPDMFWDRFAPVLREALGLQPPSLEEIEKDIQDIPQVTLSDDQVQRFLARSHVESDPQLDDLPAWLTRDDQSEVGEELLAAALHRNEGSEDEEIDALLEKHREEALQDEEDDDDRGPGEGTSPSDGR